MCFINFKKNKQNSGRTNTHVCVRASAYQCAYHPGQVPPRKVQNGYPKYIRHGHPLDFLKTYTFRISLGYHLNIRNREKSVIPFLLRFAYISESRTSAADIFWVTLRTSACRVGQNKITPNNPQISFPTKTNGSYSVTFQKPWGNVACVDGQKPVIFALFRAFQIC